MHLCVLAPHPAPPGGGSLFNAGLIPALRGLGHQVDQAQAPLPGTLPIVDTMLLPTLEPHIEALAAADAIAVVHHLAAAAGRDQSARATVHAAEARLLPRLRRVVATSAPVAQRLHESFGIEAAIVTPGLPDLPRAHPRPRGPCRIVSFGVLTPRKGHHRLLRTLARLTDLDWTLTIAGDAQRDAVHAHGLAPLAAELGLRARVTLIPDPSPDVLDAEWAHAALFALATEWEGWPQGAAEALRRGVPVVAYQVGGLPALVPSAAGLLVTPGDEATFGKVLRRAIFDRALRTSLADAAWQAGTALPGWPQQALAFDTILRS